MAPNSPAPIRSSCLDAGGGCAHRWHVGVLPWLVGAIPVRPRAQLRRLHVHGREIMSGHGRCGLLRCHTSMILRALAVGLLDGGDFTQQGARLCALFWCLWYLSLMFGLGRGCVLSAFFPLHECILDAAMVCTFAKLDACMHSNAQEPSIGCCSARTVSRHVCFFISNTVKSTPARHSTLPAKSLRAHPQWPRCPPCR